MTADTAILCKDKKLQSDGRSAFHRILEENSTGIELGVARGYFSDILLRSPKVKRLFSIDRWSDHHDSDEYIKACTLLAKHGTRSVVIRLSFEEAISLFDDESFDFIYVDAYAHTGQENGLLLERWYPKLKVGGIFSGHDYDEENWPLTYDEVNKFGQSHSAVIHVIPGLKTENYEDIYPSWFLYKEG